MLIACRQVVKSVQDAAAGKISKSTPVAKKRTAITKYVLSCIYNAVPMMI